ncbi:hypothetical protein [Oceanimonas baumannii]|uniref:hypothetical protein n=1 Tax=Oceanimonas baumannii TaxID=129578 RepID=UPI00141704B7|nr:hypothetical protein [Oceanimonas baumannii]
MALGKCHPWHLIGRATAPFALLLIFSNWLGDNMKVGDFTAMTASGEGRLVIGPALAHDPDSFFYGYA